MSSPHDGSSAAGYEPFASAFRGYRVFVLPGCRSMTSPSNSSPAPGAGTACSTASTRPSTRGSGVNVAVCLRGRAGPSFLDPMRDHRPPISECICGFWAYTTGDHPHHLPGVPVFGMIESWGRVVIGPVGFRAEKACILALCFPKPADLIDACGAVVGAALMCYSRCARTHRQRPGRRRSAKGASGALWCGLSGSSSSRPNCVRSRRLSVRCRCSTTSSRCRRRSRPTCRACLAGRTTGGPGESSVVSQGLWRGPPTPPPAASCEGP